MKLLKEGDIGLVQGLYALCPYIAGEWPLPQNPSSTENDGPLRDEGINLYRFLMQNGVHARCRQVMGTVHGTEIFISCCPDISRDTARDIATLARVDVGL